MKEQYIVICQKELEDICSKEISQFDIKIKNIKKSTITIEADLEDIYKLNISLRTSLNILKPITTFNIKNYDMLYVLSKKIEWHKFFNCNKSIRIDVKGHSNYLTNTQYVIHRVKDAIIDTFKNICNKRPDIDKNEPDIHIVIYLNENLITIYLDSSGIPLFKRGYRKEHINAPIKEDLASAILLLSDWDKKTNVFDPMCGSGTFLIEAYQIANNIPPNLNRNFSFMNWLNYDEKLFIKVKNELTKKISNSDIKIIGCECDNKTYNIAKKIINNLNISNKIEILNIDYKKINRNLNNYFIVTNPPYGERLKIENLSNLYKELGDFLKHKCAGSNCSIFTSNLEMVKKIGLRTKQKIILFNGPLEGRLLKYKIYTDNLLKSPTF